MTHRLKPQVIFLRDLPIDTFLSDEHLTEHHTIARYERTVLNSPDQEDSEDVLSSKFCLHPGNPSERSDLNLPYHSPREQVEHNYNGDTPTDIR